MKINYKKWVLALLSSNLIVSSPSIFATTPTSTTAAVIASTKTSTQNAAAAKTAASTATKATTTSVITTVSKATTSPITTAKPSTAVSATSVKPASSSSSLNKTLNTTTPSGSTPRASDGEKGSLQTANSGGPTDSGNYISPTPTGQ
ncbi:hypothetical protein [Polynucleobacter sp. QLW-P1DATA-2]|uniref:hypothetical protein n=1 Tax=Polynucleobacter sp. QLW-P1DATA-2 TaxID=1743167 RepID=UPI001160691A|nr:hypothetical protein [Polynucleobacter sp. QLW-P1DATA-2]